MSRLEVFVDTLASAAGKQGTRPGGRAVLVIGEVKAGKSRLVREMLREAVPSELRPISSFDRQTMLALEVVFGEPKLELMSVGQEAPVRYSRFPDREQLKGLDARRSWLRLAAPLECLRAIHVETNEPLGLTLVDTPGWNAEGSEGGDEFEELRDTKLVDYDVLGIILVVQKDRLQARVNHQMFAKTLGWLEDNHKSRPPILLCVRCPADCMCTEPDKEECKAFSNQELQRASGQRELRARWYCWRQGGSPEERTKVLESMWDEVLAGTTDLKGSLNHAAWMREKDQDARPILARILGSLDRARGVVADLGRQGDVSGLAVLRAPKKAKFMTPEDLRHRLHSQIERVVDGFDGRAEAGWAEDACRKHPLCDWLLEILEKEVRALRAAGALVAQARAFVEETEDEETDTGEMAALRLAAPLEEARSALEVASRRWDGSLRTALATQSNDRVVATMTLLAMLDVLRTTPAEGADAESVHTAQVEVSPVKQGSRRSKPGRNGRRRR